MTKQIPTYPLDVLAAATPRPAGRSREIYMLGQRMGPDSPFGVPYRSNYYGVGLCFKGQATVAADLDVLTIGPRCALAMPPQAIKQWHSMSEDFEHIVIFFTKAFIKERNAIDPDRFSFFQSGRHLLPLAPAPAGTVAGVLRQLQRHFAAAHPYRDELLRALLIVLLYELEALSPPQDLSAQPAENRGRQLTAGFKRLVKRHVATERHVAFYARALSVTPRHLSATVREHTGKTAGQFIQESVVLEARVLLQDAALAIGQVADALHFPDPSSFGKFFKKLTGLSPLAYRKARPKHPTF